MESLYVCLFSNGHIKVGRSIDPESRIASHAERVSCMGVDLAAHFLRQCAGSVMRAEADLIACCTGYPGVKRFRSEWFSGLDFELVCGWAERFAAKEYQDIGTSRLREFIDGLPRGGSSEFAAKVDCSTVYLAQLAARQGGREASAQLCVVIERASNYMVRRWDLRPTDWHLIWPELIGTRGAPAIPSEPEAQAA